MRVEWECGGKKDGFDCGDDAFLVGLRFSGKENTYLSMIDGIEDVDPEKISIPGYECRAVERILPNETVLRVSIMASSDPILREITRKYAGTVYVEAFVADTRVTVIV